MTAPRVYKTEAIVLKRVNVGEADKILTLYTPNPGKLSAIAKGVRRPKSKLGGHLELLTHSSLMLRIMTLDIDSFDHFLFRDFECLRCLISCWMTFAFAPL